MSTLAKRIRASAAAVMVLCATPSEAWIATEVTQMMNNFELAAELAKKVETVSQLVRTYATQYAQLQEQITAGMSIGGVTLSDVMQIQRDLNNYQNALKSLGMDLGNMTNIYDTRLSEAKILNLTFGQYLERERGRILQGNRSAKARVTREIQIMDQVKADLVLARRYGDQIQSTVGVHQAMGLMNQQGNLMLQQLNKLVMLQAEAQGSDKANEMAEKQAEEAGALARREALNEVQDNLRSKNSGIIQRMKGAK